MQAEYGRLLTIADTLYEAELFVALSQFTGTFADGHTYVWLYDDSRHFSRSVQLRLWGFSDGVFIRAASPDYAHLLGGIVIAEGGVPIDAAWRRLETPGENESSAARIAGSSLARGTVLSPAGLIAAGRAT